MTALISGLWGITKGAWLTAALLVLIRLAFHKVLSPKAKYYLWLLLALRLMLPTLPESPLSLRNFIASAPPAGASQTIEPVQADIPAPETAVLPVQQPKAETAPAPKTAEPVSDTAVSIPAVPEAPPTEAAPQPSTEFILFWLWLGGAGVVLLIQLFLYLLTALQLHRLPCCADPDTLRVFLRLKKALHIKGGPRLVSGGAGMLGGLFHPAIVLPAERHGEDAGPILLHELTHYKYGDLWLSALYRLLSAVYWFNPVVWLCFHWAISDSEAACDQRVLETGLVGAASYAEVLYEEGVLHMKRGILPQTTFGGRRHSLKRRILGIAGFRSPKLYVAVLAAALALVVAACSLTDAVTKQEDPILTAFLAAEETLLPTDAQDSGKNPGDLTEEEIDAIVAAYNQRFDTYFVEDIYPVSRKKENYEGYLRGENFGNSYCFIRSGILSYEADCLQTGETAQVTADLVSYKLFVSYDLSDGKFYVGCPASRESITAGMILEDGLWKVQSRYAEILEEWSPDPDIREVGYETPEVAIAAAGELDVETLCPLKAGTPLPSETPSSPPTEAEGKSLYAVKDGQITFLGFDWSTPIDDIRSAYPDWHVDEEYGHMDSGSEPFGENDPVHNIMLQCPPLYGYHFMFSNTIYDRDKTSYEALLEQRSLELGPPTEQEENRSVWTLGNSVLILTGSTGISGPTEYFHPADMEDFEETALEAKRVYAPYRTSGGTVTFEDTLWNMRPSQVVKAIPFEMAANFAYETTVSEEQPVLRGKAPLTTHPEVKDVYFRFGFVTDSLSMELFRVETHYDPEQVSFEQLVAQRTEELGPPEGVYEKDAFWDLGDVQLSIYPDRDGSHQEWLTRDYTHYDPELMKDVDISSYLEAIQPSIGHYGWTLEEHVAAGLLDLEQGTLEGSDADNVHVFTTKVTLGGYGPLTAQYCFSETMAGLGSGHEVLTEINVSLPEDVPFSRWLNSFASPWRERMLSSQNAFHTPFCVGALLNDSQREAIAANLLSWQKGEDQKLETMEEALNYVDCWRLAGVFYDAPRGLVLNGTGAALYTVAQGME